ncbi:hypothetical protein GQ53DRAFT_876698 [Thozetella sp. PMI_491]|nr:hypothetical protein GQ53DRAFT_876698 [Thozetella sp. PMI_491]
MADAIPAASQQLPNAIIAGKRNLSISTLPAEYPRKSDKVENAADMWWRCSRELPKCNNCRPWPSSCDYSREKLPILGKDTSLRRPEPGATTTPSPPKSGGIEGRLERLENTVEQLSASVNRILDSVTLPHQKRSIAQTPRRPAGSVVEKSSFIPQRATNPSHSFAFLKEAPGSIEAASASRTSLTHEHAYSELQFLSNTLNKIPASRQVEGEMTEFFVPLKRIGYAWMSRFLENAEIGEPFFRVPPDELLMQIVFEPNLVKEKAWVVYFNHMMLALVSAEGNSTDEMEYFRRNIHIALNDSSIFIEPREVNIQALLLLALHGENYTAPNMSWMLVGHACRQAEALGLHDPTHPDPERRQRSLALFWVVFVAEKACSLAFGRSSFLPTTIYRSIPLPDRQFLTRFHPHNGLTPGDGQIAPGTSEFGPNYICRGIELAKLIGYALDVLGPSDSTVTAEHVRLQLDEWYRETNEILLKSMNSERAWASTAQLREMSLGIASMKFQYLHVLILLLKGDRACPGRRLESAREALSLLPSMVSNWSSVYNGVIWQLLYYPFTPYFVVFENIVRSHNSLASALEQDLGLLSTTASYFTSMRSQLCELAAVCSRLEHVATVFLQLARQHIKVDRQLQMDVTCNPCSTNEGFGTIDTQGPEIASFLEWLPGDIMAPWPAFEYSQDLTTHDRPSAAEIPPLSEPKSPRGRKRPFDSTFDWFSWGAYYDEGSSDPPPF